jgi:hypothetical protein
MQKTSLMPPQSIGINQNITRINSTKQQMNTLGCAYASQPLAKNNPYTPNDVAYCLLPPARCSSSSGFLIW